ncbi:hypothetical protein BASA81_008146 [Batrachochytrium salamandrivorans]|nr:hypothetical protein BASA81_008146 [Batrachochytrium salamandrivorans]
MRITKLRLDMGYLGDTNEGDGVDQASGSKDVTSLPRRTTSTTLPTTLQESNTSDQNGASSSTDIRPGNECTGGHGIRKISSPCPQQQSPPEPQSSTSYDPPQSDKMPLPARVERLAAEFYNQNWESEQYNAFIAGETKYFESEYRSEKELVEQCMSPRSPNILLPYEFIVQRYLSRPGYENPYVPMVFDYYTLKYEYVLVMEYFDEDWVNLAKYVEEKERLDISEARNIFREIVNGVISLKRHGVVNRDIHAHPFAHLVVECEQVAGHCIQSGLVPAIQKSRLRLLGRALDPGMACRVSWI